MTYSFHIQRLAFVIFAAGLLSGSALCAQQPFSPVSRSSVSPSTSQESPGRKLLPVSRTIPAGDLVLDHDFYFASLFAGAGVDSEDSTRSGSAHIGGAVGSSTLAKRPGGFGFLQLVEVGAMGPFPARNAPAAFVSYDLGTTVLLSDRTRTVPFAAAGYSYVFGQASGFNFGVGVDRYYAGQRAIRLEIRDYLLFTAQPQHNVALRVAWEFSVHNP